MGQALIRNLDDAILDDYREAARRNGRSLEAELREALARARPMSEARQAAVLKRLAKIRAMTPKGVSQTPSERIVREVRGGDLG
jgi:plasmid stability protein